MKFHCDHCGKEIRVPRSYTGRKGRCPDCKAVIRIPATESQTSNTTSSEAAKQNPFANLTFLDAPEMSKPESEPEPPLDQTDEAYEQYRKLQGGFGGYEHNEVQKRKFPWIIDIFLYPFNTKGMSIILLCVGVPFLLKLLQEILHALSGFFLPIFVFFALVRIIQWMSLIIFILYICWYWYECILDSASGGIRAPETAGTTPGVGEILRQTFRTVACFCYSMLPAVVYVGYSQKYDDPICRLLCGFGFFLFPMIILAVAVFDSILVANPFLVIGSMFSTFFQYLGVVILCPAPFLLFLLALYLIFSPGLWLLAYLFMLLSFYLNLVFAHVMGRFFWKYRDKLNWEV